MKKILITVALLCSLGRVMAQAEMDFPFQGGSRVMMDFFAKNIRLTPAIKQRAAGGVVIMKFSADEKGAISKMVVYYADDASLAQPVIAALKLSGGRWIVPDKQKTYDFLIPFTFVINSPDGQAGKAMLQYYSSRNPIMAADQIPLNLVSLLPAVKVSYDYSGGGN